MATAKAPIRENLAAAILMASGWDKKSPLLDPFCGSGTIAIEAAMMVKNIKPGRARQFAFMRWPGYSPLLWEELTEENETNHEFPTPAILASDRNAGAIRAASANAARAGVAESISFSCRSFSAMEIPSSRGWVVTNPPYGRRTKSGENLQILYKTLGQILREKCRGWRIAMLGDNPRLVRLTGIDFDPGIPVFHGGLKVKLYRGKIA